MVAILANNATSTLAADISSGALSLTIQSGDASKFPTPGGGDWFALTLIKADRTFEIVKATARSSATITIERAKEGTTAKAFTAGDRVELRPTAGSIQPLLGVTPGATGLDILTAATLAAARAKLGVFDDSAQLAAASVDANLSRIFVGGMAYEPITTSFWNLEPSVVVDGGMDDGSAYTMGSGWSVGSGVATHTPGSASAMSQNGIIEIGRYYLTRLKISALTVGNFRLNVGSVQGAGRSAVGTYTQILGPAASVNFNVQATASTSAGAVDDLAAWPLPLDALPSADGRWWGLSQTYARVIVSDTDPGAVGPYVIWVDTST